MLNYIVDEIAKTGKVINGLIPHLISSQIPGFTDRQNALSKSIQATINEEIASAIQNIYEKSLTQEVGLEYRVRTLITELKNAK